MAEEIEDTAFYREDFSTESDWEVYHAQLRELFQEFELSDFDRESEKEELFKCEWDVKIEKLELLKKKILIKYYSANLEKTNSVAEVPKNPNEMISPMHKDLLEAQTSFPTSFDRQTLSQTHPLARYFGLRQFVVIHPEAHYFTNPAEFSFFLSGAVVAATETSSLPIFVQIYDPKWNYFLGVGSFATMRTNFDVVAIEHAPIDLRYLAGLLRVFHEKIGESYTQPITVSVRITYMLERSIRIPGHIPFSKNLTSSESNSFSTSEFVALPHGYLPSSRTELYVAYTWNEIAENIAMDSALSSDFTPLNAPYGTIYQSTQATSYMSSCLRDYLKIRNGGQSLETFVGKNFSELISASDVPNPLDRLTEHNLTLRTHNESRNNRLTIGKLPKKINGPMNEFELDQMLLYLFPDIQPEVALWPYRKNISCEEFDPLRIKSALPDSLVCRLSCLLANCNAHFGGLAGLSQIWAAFTRELRLLWDNGLFVPGTSAGFPDTRTCLLHQKLQMLNVCVERRRQREFGIKETEAGRGDLHASRLVKQRDNKLQDITQDSNITDDDDDDEDIDDDDEFYDCSDELPSVNANKPEGRLKRLGELKLLDHSNESLYVPVTQEPVPKTEDQLHADAEVMLKLGPGSGLTTQMMCESLLSDMEAFKAANPKAKMEDFIRWYSPKDWEEETDEFGNITAKLSARMTAPDNTWLTVWQQAQPISAWRQKRLFDDTIEALKVLNYLETRKIGEIYELTIIPLLHSAILKLKDILTQCEIEELFSNQIETILNDLCRLSRDVEIISETETSTVTQLPNPEPVIKQLEALETQLYQYKCFELMAGYLPNQQKQQQQHHKQHKEQHQQEYQNRTIVNLQNIKRKFKETLENGGTCKFQTRKNVHDATVGRAAADGTTSTTDNSIFGIDADDCELKLNLQHELHDNLISKEYVLRANSCSSSEGQNTTKEQTGPQFLRAIVNGESLRLCGAFTEHTTFVE